MTIFDLLDIWSLQRPPASVVFNKTSKYDIILKTILKFLRSNISNQSHTLSRHYDWEAVIWASFGQFF